MKNPQLAPAAVHEIPEYWNMGLYFLERPERVDVFASKDEVTAHMIRILMDEVQHLRERVEALERITQNGQ